MSPLWVQEDLVRRLCLALSIAKRAIGILGEDGYYDEEAPEDSFGRDKPLAETAMLLHVASAVTGHVEVKKWVDELSLLLVPYARSHRTACAIALHPSICFQLAMPHILLSQLGLRDDRFDRLIAASSESLAHHGREVVPHRALEGMWLKSLWSGTPPGTEFDTAAFSSVLNHPVDLLWGSREDAYAHTHSFMYFTNFGYSRRSLPRPQLEILGESAGVLARSLLLEDYDLAAEVLMAWPLTSAHWNPAATFGFRVLANFEDMVGFLPAGNGVPEKFDRLAGSERTKYALAATYHTALVMGMLCALALRPGNAPPYEITGPLAPSELIDELLSMIPIADTPWQHTFRQLQPEEQRTLGPFLLDMAILSRGRSHDFSAVGKLLNTAVQHGLANTPLCAHTAELLHRIAACTDSRLDPD
jgi:hypothetical protein